MADMEAKVMIDHRPGGPWVTLHTPDGGAAVTLADVLARMGIPVQHGDRLKISIRRLPRRKSVTFGVRKKKR